MSKAFAVLPLWSLFLAAGLLLTACGGPPPSESGAESPETPTSAQVAPEQEEGSVTALDIIPPSSSMSCSRNRFSGALTCTGTGANGVTPYTYQWKEDYYYETDGYSSTGSWYNGSQSYSGYCPFGFYSPGYYWNVTVSFRVVDANGYISTNTPSQTFNCSTPL